MTELTYERTPAQKEAWEHSWSQLVRIADRLGVAPLTSNEPQSNIVIMVTSADGLTSYSIGDIAEAFLDRLDA